MKRTFTLLIVLFFGIIGHAQQDVILVKWTFANDNLTDTLVETYSDLNGDATMGTMGGTSTISMKNGLTTKAAQAEGWDNGMDMKAWRISLNTTGYENIKLNSVQQSGNTDPGPKDFKVQVKIGEAGAWTDIPNGMYEVANDWTTGALVEKPLPQICNNQPLVFVRWIMASNLSVAGTDVLVAGKTKIDDIMVTGDVLSGMNENPTVAEVKIYPNPSVGDMQIESKSMIQYVEIFNNNGSKVAEILVNDFQYTLHSKLTCGLYNMLVYFGNQTKPVCKRIVVE